MRLLFAIAMLLCANGAVPEHWEEWDATRFGAPCTTATDRREGTCNLKVLSKPRRVKHVRNRAQ